MVGIDANTALTATTLMAIKATDAECRNETNASGYSQDGRNLQRRLRKNDTQHRDTQKPHVCSAGIKSQPFVH